MGYARTLPNGQLEFGSMLKQTFTVTNVATDIPLTGAYVTIPNLDMIISSAYVDMYIPFARNTGAGANTTATAQSIQVKKGALGAYMDCISIPPAVFLLENGETFTGLWRLTGDVDISSLGINNSELRLQWHDSRMSLNGVDFHNIWFIVRVIGE